MLQIHVRRFVCRNRRCSRRIFCERIPSLAGPHAQRTHHLRHALERIGFALGGEAGARLAVPFGMATSPATLLRLVRAAPGPSIACPQVVGIDDWAFRKRKRYGTIVVDLQRHCPIDVLDDRSAESVATWLEQYPGITVVSRDRGGVYIEGATRGAPAAIQVADRWHLLKNLNESLERLLLRHQTALRDAAAGCTIPVEDTETTGPEEAADGPAPRLTRAEQERERRRARRYTRYQEVRALGEQGLTIQAIARQLGMARRTIRTFLGAEDFPERAERSPGTRLLAPYEAYLRQRWDAGCQNGQTLLAEIQQRGYRGSATTLYVGLARWRTEPAPTGRPRYGLPARQPEPRAMQPLSPRQAAWLLQRRPDDLDAEEQESLKRLCQSCPVIERAQTLTQEFGRMVRERDPAALDPWLAAVADSGLSELQSFATGLQQDRPAVDAALATEWSNGQTEGQVNRLKGVS